VDSLEGHQTLERGYNFKMFFRFSRHSVISVREAALFESTLRVLGSKYPSSSLLYGFRVQVFGSFRLQVSFADGQFGIGPPTDKISSPTSLLFGEAK